MNRHIKKLPLILLVVLILGMGVRIWGPSAQTTNWIAYDYLDQKSLLEENVQNWGLGDTLSYYKTNDRPYEWYVDQAHTGKHANDNCGPASIAMAGLWQNPNFNVSGEQARRAYRSFGGWWYTEDIENSLKKYDISYFKTSLEDAHTLMSAIDAGHIVLVLNEMKHIAYEGRLESRTGRFYTFSGGHFFLIKGYAIVDQNIFFEVYDPNNWDEAYDDGTPKGKNRYYASDEVVKSILEYYNVIFIIKGGKHEQGN